MAMEQFNGKIIIITGAASGIGKTLAEKLVKFGATVYAADIRFEAATTLEGGKLYQVPLDVTQAEQVQQVVDNVVKEQGRLDYIFNNAGFAITGELRDVTAAHWDKIIAVNLRGVTNGVAAAYPLMVKQGFGHIVNTASVAGLIPSPPLSAYSTTKYAVVGLSKNLRLEAATLGVKVSAICPGFINTGIYDAATYLKTDKARAMSTNPFKLVEVEVAGDIILREVAKNKAIIIFPLYAKLLWWTERYFPFLGLLLLRKAIADFRKIRSKTPD